MPFRSEKQKRFLFANKPKMAKQWADETNIKKLPQTIKVKLPRKKHGFSK